MSNGNATGDDFAAFLRERERASTAFVNGDIGPLAALSAQASPASVFGPKGNYVLGAGEVNAANAGIVGTFQQGSTNTLTTMHHASSGDLGYWVGIQESDVRMKGQDKTVPFRLRVTEIYRREEGQWRLVHRHADPMASADA